MLSLKTVFLRFVVIVFLLAVLLFPAPARADIAPPEQPPGVNPLPESELTRVRMIAETVLIDVTAIAPSGSLGQARVTADFTLHNLGEEPETMGVRFPLSANDGFYNYPEITGLEVRVGGQLASTRQIELVNEYDESIPWAEFDVTFPPGQDVFIQVAYTLEGTGEYPYISFKYILETGAGWNNTIGEGDIIVRLPYQANDYNVIFDEQIGWSETSSGAILAENEVRWHFENLDPTSQDNFQVSLVMPSAWQKVLIEQENVTNNPQDGEAWGRLGKIYKEISRLRRGLREDVGGQELYLLSQQAYEQAIMLLPDDALWHAGYADLLWNHYYYDVYFSDQSEIPELIQILELLDRSLTLTPGNSVAVELLTEISYAIPEAVQINDGEFIIHYLTATPFIEPTTTNTPLPTETLPDPTETLMPSATPAPTNTPPPTASPVPPTLTATSTPMPIPAQPGLPICGAALLVFLTAFRRKKNGVFRN
ncbi:MAG TPA: hypothetical protein VI451_20630 [Anaerolineales bacterium]|nr:hypothetical protein [Anaerolineales bacterium]